MTVRETYLMYSNSFWEFGNDCVLDFSSAAVLFVHSFVRSVGCFFFFNLPSRLKVSFISLGDVHLSSIVLVSVEEGNGFLSW